MPTTFYLRSTFSGIGGAGDRYLSQRSGRSPASTAITTTVAGGTNITVTATAGGQALQWFTEPITAAITISGTVTVNIRGLESANTVNAGRGILIQRTDIFGVVQSTILADSTVPATITEFTTTDAANGAATYTPTSTAMAVGERIKVTLKVRNVGTMAAGTVTISYNGSASGASGDTYVRFTEDIRTDESIEVPSFEIYGSNGYTG